MEPVYGQHAHYVSRALRVVVAAALALVVALFFLYVSLSIVSHFGKNGTAQKTGSQLSDEQKLQILAALEASSSASTADKKATLKSLQSASSSAMSDQQKLDVLSQLRGK